jgi:hypothetical protein
MSRMEAAASLRTRMSELGDERWDEHVPQYWCAGDAFETRLLEAMSLIAPEVERFVIGAVVKYTRRPGAETCAPDATAFIHEEAEHSRVHKRFNQRLALQGFDPVNILSPVRTGADIARRWLPATGQLAIAAACEHLAAVLSLSFLRAQRRSEIRPASVLHLFEQHARDEIGHRAIVFDLLRDAGATSWLARAAALALVSVAAAFCVPRVVKALLKGSDALSRRRRARAWAGVGHWFSPSLFLKGWFSYLRPHFHPRHLPDC